MNPVPQDLTGQVVPGNQASLNWEPPETSDTQVFLSNGSYTTGAAVVTLDVMVIAAGGGGSGAVAITNGTGFPAGAGGAGGGFVFVTGADPSLFSSPVAITVGTAGVGGAGGSETTGVTIVPPVAGTTGGNASFGSYLTATGGTGGANDQSNPPLGGTASSTVMGATATAGGTGGLALDIHNAGTPAASTVSSPSGGGGGVGNTNNPQSAGAGGAVSGLSLTGGAAGLGKTQPGGGPNTTLVGGSGSPGNASVGYSPGSGGGGGGVSFLQNSDTNCNAIGGNGAAGGGYGSGGGGGGAAIGCTDVTSTNVGGNGGAGGPGVVVVTENFQPPDSYNVYRNGTLIATGITGLSLTDPTPGGGDITYVVTAVYSGQESGDSNPVTLNFLAPVYGKFVGSAVYPAVEISQVGAIIPRIWSSKKNNTVQA